MSGGGNHCSFVLLAEFHLLEGAQLKCQFPQPLGIDEGVLAMSMLPDGAETQLDDWTVFFLNQTPFNTIQPVLALDDADTSVRSSVVGDQPDLLCVLNLVRTKHDKTWERGAKVLALAICTRHPFIQIFKPVLLMALDDYFLNPSQDCLSRLFDAVNSMDLAGAPSLTRAERLLMRTSDRKDLFAEKFYPVAATNNAPTPPAKQHRTSDSIDSYSSFEEDILMRARDNDGASRPSRDRADTASSIRTASTLQSASQHAQSPPSETSFSLGGSAVWVGDESGLDYGGSEAASSYDGQSILSGSSTLAGSSVTSPGRKRRSTGASTSSALPNGSALRSHPVGSMAAATKDTHFYHTTVQYKDHQLPIKMPLFTFPEEVGDYSLITLVKLFSSPALVSGPQHPHLHTNGPATHPIIILFNALVTGKRIIFLGHKRPAGEVSTFVLAACALGSGCGAVLRGFIERAFPYANLNNKDEWESVPAYIAGVTNPIFQQLGAWDVLFDIATGTVTISRDIMATYPPTPPPPGLGSSVVSRERAATLKADNSVGSEDGTLKNDTSKADNSADNLFIDDIRAAIEYHYGENAVRLRFTEYVTRFVRLASRFEEEVTGTTKIGYPSQAFTEGGHGRLPQLGSGVMYNDDATLIRELALNAHRLEAFRHTLSHRYLMSDFAKQQIHNRIKGCDVLHQIFRLKHAKISDMEASVIMRTLVENCRSYEQVVELLAMVVPTGGLTQLAFGLFHPHEVVRETTVELFNQLRETPVGVLFLQTLNQFQRFAYVRLAQAREQRLQAEHHLYPPALQSRTHSNSSAHSEQRLNGPF
ncbi:docking domain of Afi1 for Arf3 in vesicle trafficking-domain-containing protein [Schizophyllum amplum]|uniref:Docking domain of Afi1 for Arf3 in vesicle trafficking-domain-containing protein n=1 Tax=Schizophyllum amplum TaxID=97359 RepID=A0A550CZC1_9AGAR|nr:docking domain of Afi1 for Arf3 in vesicle trafficking-domain-containing protein [Auriculariopsis ampla]